MTAGVWGAGAEGRSAARALLAEGQDVLVVTEADTPRPDALDPRPRYASGPGSLELLLDCALVVVSPGVPGTHPFRSRLQAAGIPLTSLTDRWMSAAAERTIGVTGTKGKSTTTTLIGLLLQAAGVDAQTGGNIGVPLADLRPTAQATVAELSSYQCASLHTAPRIAVITSLYEDHLTWHGSRQAYWHDKARIAGTGCEALVCDDDTLAALHSIDAILPARIIGTDAVAPERIPVSALPEALTLRQNLHNLRLAIAAADLWLARPLTTDEILAATGCFTALPHRLERVAERGGVVWVDDTLSTVPESVIAASEAFPGDIVLIVGGEERGIPYERLSRHLAQRQPLAQLVAIPSNGPRIVADYQAAHPELVHHAPTLDAAVALAAGLASPGVTVVLSPGAPSYDHFTNYEHKSQAFITAIQRLDG